MQEINALLPSLIVTGIVASLAAPAFLILYAVVFLAPLLALGPLVMPVARMWDAPARVLVLRPFDREWITKPLVASIANMRALGHFYTLADQRLRVPWHIRVPYLRGFLSFLAFRSPKVRRPQDILALRKAVNRILWRNVNWLVSATPIFAVASSDAAWRPCVAMLIHEADIVVLDLSHTTPSIAWEVEHIQASGALDRAIVVTSGDPREAKAFLVRHCGEQARDVAVLNYGENDLLDVDRVMRAAPRVFGAIS